MFLAASYLDAMQVDDQGKLIQGRIVAFDPFINICDGLMDTAWWSIQINVEFNCVFGFWKAPMTRRYARDATIQIKASCT